MPKEIKKYIENLTPTFVGKCFYYLLPIRKRIVLHNMNVAFGEILSKDEIKKLALCFYSHVARSLWENSVMRFMSEEAIRSRARVEGYEYVIKASENNKGVIVFTGHFGNWEFAPIAGILNFSQFKGRFHFIRRTIRWQWLERILLRRYYTAGLGVIPKKHSIYKVLDALSNNDVVIFIIDQSAAVPRDGVWVKLFNWKVGIFRSLATIARNTGAPVIPATSFRDEKGQHVLRFGEPIPWQPNDDTKQEIIDNTQIYVNELERNITAHPEQWLWFHRLFKHEKGD